MGVEFEAFTISKLSILWIKNVLHRCMLN